MNSRKKYVLPQRIHLKKFGPTQDASQINDQNTSEVQKLLQKQDDKSNIKKQLRKIRLSLDIYRIKNNFSQAKSDYSIGRKTAYKRKIMQQKKSHNFLRKKKARSYSIDQSFESLKRKDVSYQQHQIKTNRPRLVNVQNIMSTFLNECYRIQAQYIINCQKGKYNQAFQNLALLLNYSVDISSQAWFFKVLFGMCQFYEILQVYKFALKLYNQMKEASILKKNYQYLTISLIGISKCASKAKLQNEAIFILKKALQYAWYIDSTQLQLNIYDQLGQKYYKMGEIEKASAYHRKYVNSITEQKTSPLRALSRQQIQIQQQKNIGHNYQNLSALLLAHLNLPVTSTEQLSPLIPNLFTSRSKLSLKTLKLELQTFQIDYQIRRLLKTWLFQVQSSQPNIQNTKVNTNQSFYQSRKFAYLDFKLNYHLKMKGINYSNPRNHFKESNNNKQQIKKKQTLEQQIKRFVEDPGLQKQWYQKMVKRVQVDHKRKMNQVNNPVRINKSALPTKTKFENLKTLFKQIIELSKIIKIQPVENKK